MLRRKYTSSRTLSLEMSNYICNQWNQYIPEINVFVCEYNIFTLIYKYVKLLEAGATVPKNKFCNHDSWIFNYLSLVYFYQFFESLMQCILIIFISNPNSYLIHSSILTILLCILTLNSFLSNLCISNIAGCMIFHWSVVDLPQTTPRTTLLEKIIFPFSSN